VSEREMKNKIKKTANGKEVHSITAPVMVETFPADDVPTLYANHASTSLSFNDIRIYFNEVGPKQLETSQASTIRQREATITPRLCIVVSPEFAKSLAENTLIAVEKYEHIFGPLRVAPTGEQFLEKIAVTNAHPR
jgi:hypothetical protein